MNLQDRTQKYLDRRFQQNEAEVLVLIEETALAVFEAFPDRFVLFGGATLVLFYESPRFSRDLDLLASVTAFPPSDKIQSLVRHRIQPIAETFGLGHLEFRKDKESSDFVKQWVIANDKPLFSIDLTRIGGNVLESQVLKKNIPGTNAQTVLTASANYLLLQKCEVFLDRRHLKARDAFDIHLLLSQGALLTTNLKAHLEDFIMMKDLDREFIQSRIERIDSKLCTVELRPVLPYAVFEELAQKGFEPIRQSLRTVLSQWIEEG
ncbi:MAG TPA: nucleotidyl transferase AbiEii/AbiGii toxin family protein [Pyrinomonadaceae bacterium]|nr:nucleotidyl transferase AbiEii/AbiGii toxin family protein [Pyrinomonadaceae bacterium]